MGCKGPDGAERAAVFNQPARGAAGSSLGMSPEKKSLIFLPMSPIGLSPACWAGRASAITRKHNRGHSSSGVRVPS